MKSHEYEAGVRDWLRVLLPTLCVLVLLAGLLQTINRLGFLPAPPLASYPDTTALAHQSRAARSRDPAQILLLGDSTCMVGVDAPALSAALPGHPPARNLALFIWLDFNSYAEVLSDFLTANPGQVRDVLLLVTPDKLAMTNHSEEAGFWRQVRNQEQHGGLPATESASWRDWFGAGLVRQKVMAQVLAMPLRGQGAGTALFGFSSGIDYYMTEHRGSFVDLGNMVPPVRAEPREFAFAPDLESQSRGLRSKVPPGTRLLVGFTPAPRSASTLTPAQRSDLLRRWNAWLHADVLLTNLPPVMPDVFFSSGGHLNPAGQKQFTRLLARELAPLLGPAR